MKTQTPKRTKRMVLWYIMEQLGGERMKDNFNLQFDHRIDPAVGDEEMTEAEYQSALQKIREELPAFKRYLLTHRPLPYEFYRFF